MLPAEPKKKPSYRGPTPKNLKGPALCAPHLSYYALFDHKPMAGRKALWKAGNLANGDGGGLGSAP